MRHEESGHRHFQITPTNQDMRDYASGLEAAATGEAEADMAEKSAEFRAQGSELYPEV